MQVITTKYCGPTDTRGSRIAAASSTGRCRLTVPYDDGLNTDENHDRAAMRLAAKLGWTRQEWAPGTTETGHVYVAVTPGTLLRAEVQA